MPGIFGCLNRSSEPISEEMAIKMINSMKHEDWYIYKYVLNSCLLGKIEMGGSINENNVVHESEQSFRSVLTGKIYNGRELAEKFGIEDYYYSNTSLVVQLYKKTELDFVKYLNGSYVAAIYDEEKDRVVIINDRHGFFPLFYSLTPTSFVFASEAKAILADTSIAYEMNKAAVAEFFIFKFLLTDKTFFNSTKYMPPANVLIYDRPKDQVSLKQYWNLAPRREQNRSLESYLEEFKELMKRAVGCRVKDKKEVGVFLSGGLDSRLIAAFASETSTPIITFTFGAKGCIQQKIAKQIAERLGVPNIFLEIPPDFIARYASSIVHKGDGLVRIRDCHFVAILELIRKKVSTILLGTAGGELFGQTLPAKIFSLREKEELITYLFEKKTIPYSEEFQKVFLNSFYDEVKDKISQDFYQTFEGVDFASMIDIAHYWEIVHYLPRYIFQAFQYYNWYVEARHPFLDNDLVDFAFSLPSSFKLNENLLQKALNFCFPSLSDIPSEHTGVPPDSSLIRVLLGEGRIFMLNKLKNAVERLTMGKRPLRPIDYRGYSYWLRTGSRDYVKHILLDPKTLGNGFFRAEHVKRIVEEHLRGMGDHAGLICDLINFELMTREFFSNQHAQ
jgi:asparagine synthase (glutamine-hydrolysing)